MMNKNIFFNDVSKHIIVKRLLQQGFEVCLVGGAVRDWFLKKKPDDLDFATNASYEDVVAIFKDRKIKTVGKRFKVALVDGFEVATYRKDRYECDGDRKNVEITNAKSIEDDLGRRDLTCNAIAYNFKTEKIIDPHNGINDIKNKSLRFVGFPFDRITEDPTRILRVLRFECKLGFRIEEITWSALLNSSNFFKKIFPEMKKREILKVLKTDDPRSFFKRLRLMGCLNDVFPSLNECVHFDGGKHHSETVFKHCLDTMFNINKRFPFLRLAGLLHDAEKPRVAKKNDDGNIIFHHHEKIKRIKTELESLKFSNSEVKYITSLITNHMKILQKD